MRRCPSGWPDTMPRRAAPESSSPASEPRASPVSYDWVIDALFWISVVFLAAVYVSWRPTRLDRLHIRVETARAALDAALVRRAAASLELAASRLLDPATSLVLATAAHEARTADVDNREFAESDLSRALRAVVDQPDFVGALTAGAPGDGEAVLDELTSSA